MDIDSIPPPALRVRGLRKTFVRPAVDDLDLTIRGGEFYALLGPNGAGKTTTLRLVVGLLKPEAGAISVFGIDALADPVAAKRILAWVSDEPMIYRQAARPTNTWSSSPSCHARLVRATRAAPLLARMAGADDRRPAPARHRRWRSSSSLSLS